MNTRTLSPTRSAGQKRHDPLFILITAWLLLDLLALIPVQQWLGASFPLFTFLWLVPPLGVLLATRDPGRIGIRRVTGKAMLAALGLNALGVFLVMLLCEPWSGAYRALVGHALAAATPDITFAWLLRLPGPAGLAAMFLFTALVSIFAEELFFRGWLLQWLAARMPVVWAILLQALLFSLPQALVAFVLSPRESLVYLAAYSFLAVGVIGGWADWRVKSIWPSVITASLMNLALVMMVRF